MAGTNMTKNELAVILDARDKLCGFCENYDFCPHCQVTLLVDQAYSECEEEDEE